MRRNIIWSLLTIVVLIWNKCNSLEVFGNKSAKYILALYRRHFLLSSQLVNRVKYMSKVVIYYTCMSIIQIEGDSRSWPLFGYSTRRSEGSFLFFKNTIKLFMGGCVVAWSSAYGNETAFLRASTCPLRTTTPRLSTNKSIQATNQWVMVMVN